MRSIASHPLGPHGRLAPKRNRAPISGGEMGRHNLHRVCQNAVTAPPRVCCVVWSPGILVCISFLISVCMFIVSKALLISSATVIVRAMGAIWFNPFAKVLFTVCCSITIEYYIAWECLVYLFPCCYVRKKALLQYLQLLRGGIWACMRCHCLCLCWVLG